MAFGVASSGLLARWREREIIEPCQHLCVHTLRSAKTFSPLGAAFSAGAAWSGARKRPEGRRRNLERFQRQHGPID